MKDVTALSREQLFCVVFMSVIGNIVYIHTWVYDDVGRAAWVASFIGILPVIPPAVLLLRLGRNVSRGTLPDIIGAGLGKFAAAAASLAYFTVTVGLAATHIAMFTELINTFFLQYTPPWFLVLDIVVMGALFASGSLTTLARWLEVMAVLGVVNYFATFIVAVPTNFHVEYILPVFAPSAAGMCKSVLFYTGNAAETLLVLTMAVGFVESPEKKAKCVAYGVVTAAAVFSLAIMVINAMMSPELAKRIAFGGVNAARLIRVGDFVQGLEVFILMAYQLIAICRVALLVWCAWTALRRLAGGKAPRVLLLMTSGVLLVAALAIGSYNEAYGLSVLAAWYLTLPLALLLLLLGALGARRLRNRLKGAESGQ